MLAALESVPGMLRAPATAPPLPVLLVLTIIGVSRGEFCGRFSLVAELR